MNKKETFEVFVRKQYEMSGILKNEFKTFEEIRQRILSGHEVLWANENYNVIIVNNDYLAIYCNLNGFSYKMEECEIPGCYSK